jgi:ribosomal protein L37AE/L43A
MQLWARVRSRAECPLRRGAWYRVVDVTPVEAILEVNNHLLHIPRAWVQILPLRPPLWSVVEGSRDATGQEAGTQATYGVCPNCAARAALHRTAATWRCQRCGTVSTIGWSDSDWRPFEVRMQRPTARTLARARAHALRALATAFGLRS